MLIYLRLGLRHAAVKTSNILSTSYLGSCKHRNSFDVNFPECRAGLGALLVGRVVFIVGAVFYELQI